MNETNANFIRRRTPRERRKIAYSIFSYVVCIVNRENRFLEFGILGISGVDARVVLNVIIVNFPQRYENVNNGHSSPRQKKRSSKSEYLRSSVVQKPSKT